MSSGRPAKRARQKERRDARREAVRQAVRRRRRQRVGVLAASLALIGGGVLIVLFTRGGGEEASPQASPEDTAPALVAPTPQPVACGADLPEAASSSKQSYSSAADQELDPNNTYILRLETSCGEIEVELDVEGSPRTTNSVVFLAREGFYDGLVFHRIVPGFVVQGGDPRGDGTGGPGYDVVEPPPDDAEYAEGTLAMAKGQNDPPGTSGSQFFIVSGPEASDLPAEYALLGTVIEGMGVVEEISEFAGEGGAQPTEWVYIERATVVEG